MRIIPKLFNLIALLVLGTVFWMMHLSPALAWNTAGHMVSGAIAYSELQRNDPEAVEQGVALLQHALPSDYAAIVKPIAEQRIVLSGYRLADWLEENF